MFSFLAAVSASLMDSLLPLPVGLLDAGHDATVCHLLLESIDLTALGTGQVKCIHT